MPRTPLEAYAFDARFGKRSVFILIRACNSRLNQYSGPQMINENVRPLFLKKSTNC